MNELKKKKTAFTKTYHVEIVMERTKDTINYLLPLRLIIHVLLSPIIIRTYLLPFMLKGCGSKAEN